MIKYALKLAFRNLWKNRVYTLINILGLWIGIATLIYIALWAYHELSYDRHYTNSDRIYRLTVEINEPGGRKTHFARCWQDWVNLMPEYFPEIESMTRFAPLRRTAVKYDNISFYMDNAYYCDSTVFDIFDLDIIEGNKDKSLRDPSTLIISKNLLKRLPDESIPGTDIKLSGEHDTVFNNFQIDAIFNDFPSNSHFHPDILVTLENPEEFSGWAYYYCLLAQDANVEDILSKVPGFMDKHLHEEQRKISTIHLQPIHDIHLNSHKDREIENNYSMQLVIVFLIVGIAVYLLAIFNYINLNLALNYNRVKGFLINRIIGARKSDLYVQMMSESIILCSVTALLSLISLIIYTGDNTMVNSDPTEAGLSILFFFVPVIIVTSLLGTIPSWFQLISFNMNTDPVKASKTTGKRKTGIIEFKKILVILQFVVSIILIIGAIHINRQNKFLLSKRLGINSDPVIVIKGMNWIVKDQYFPLKERLIKSPYVVDVTASSEVPSGRVMDAMGFNMSGFSNEEKQLRLGVFVADDNFFPFFDIPILTGSNFPIYNMDLKKEDYIINETAVRYLGYDDPEDLIGRELKMDFFIKDIFHGGKIVGVVKDFNLSTLHYRIQPLVIFQKDIWFWNFLVKVDPDHVSEAITYLSGTWKDMFPDYAFDYSFNEDLFHTAYQNESNQANLMELFTTLAILLAILGLFGLSSLMIEQRTKEIGIRKVNGATTNKIMFLLNRQFTIWIIISMILGMPTAYILLEKWDQNFAYSIPVSPWIFPISGIIALFIGWLTISWQSIKAARKNPVEALRYE